MKYPSIENVIEKMRSSPRVKGIFTTGTSVSKLTPASDLDLVVILDKNQEDIKSVYTTIQDHFSDIFFFDKNFLTQLKDKLEVSGNDFEGMFVEWLAKGEIKYDPENFLRELKTKITASPPIQKVLDSGKRDFWIKTNYNFIANFRYYNSGDKLYHQALEFRLLYSVIELVTAYFSFRDLPWRGEKAAVKYLEKNDPEFLLAFKEYSTSKTTEDKMKYYQKLFNKIFVGEYQKWEDNFVVSISNRNQYDKNLISLWDSLVGG